MPIQFIWYRIRYRWRNLTLLLIAISLASGFLALESLYANALSEGYLRVTLDDATPRDFQISLRSLNTPIEDSVTQSLHDNIGVFLEGIDRTLRTRGVICPLGVREEDHCHQIITFENPEALLEIVDGEFPRPLENTDDPEAPQFEVLVSPDVAEIIRLSVGDVIVFSEGNASEARFRISGIGQPIEEDRPFWDFEGVYLTGTRTPFGTSFRRDYGIFVLPEVYNETIQPVLDADTIEGVHTWRVEANVVEINAQQLRQQTSALEKFQQDFFQIHPEGEITGTLIPLLTDLRNEIAITEAPVFIIALTIFVIIMIQLLYLSVQIIDHEHAEWNNLYERGASINQMLRAQFMTVSIVALLSLIFAPIIGLIALRLFDSIGLIATVLNNAEIMAVSISGTTLLFSFGAITLSWLVVIASLWLKHREHQEETENPSSQPFFLRYYFDIGLLVIGLLFLLRLYILTSGNLSESIETLLNDPSSLIRELADQADERSLVDPFSLIGPIILMVGGAMFIMRFIPLVMRLLGWVGKSINNLAFPLPLWTSGRGIRQYSSSLILFITILAFCGTAYALTATQDDGAWDRARLQNGDTVRITLDPYTDTINQNWTELPNVEAQTPALIETGNIVINDITDTTRLAQLIGIDETLFGENFPEYQAITSAFQAVDPPTMPGIELPPNSETFSLQLYSSSEDDEEATRVSIIVNLRDTNGVPFDLQLESDDEYNSGSFIEYSGAIPASIGETWRLVGLTINSERGEARDFEHRIFIDNVMVAESDGNSSIVADFETNQISDWQQSPDWRVVNRASPRPVIVRNRNIMFNGEASLQIDYQIRWAAGNLLAVSVPINGIAFDEVPLVLSTELARYIGSATTARVPLEVNDRGELALRFDETVISFDFVVIGILDEILSRTDDARFIVAPANRILPYLNWQTDFTNYFGWNHVWLRLDSRQASLDLQTTLSNMEGVEEVTYAWDDYLILTQNPLTSAISGIFYMGFWFALAILVLIIIIDLLNPQPDEIQDYRVLHTLGWSNTQLHIWLILKRIIPASLALIAGLGLGIALAYLLLPFLKLISNDALNIPWSQYITFSFGILIGFTILLFTLTRQSIKTALRTTEE